MDAAHGCPLDPQSTTSLQTNVVIKRVTYANVPHVCIDFPTMVVGLGDKDASSYHYRYTPDVRYTRGPRLAMAVLEPCDYEGGCFRGHADGTALPSRHRNDTLKHWRNRTCQSERC